MLKSLHCTFLPKAPKHLHLRQKWSTVYNALDLTDQIVMTRLSSSRPQFTSKKAFLVSAWKCPELWQSFTVRPYPRVQSQPRALMWNVKEMSRRHLPRRFGPRLYLQKTPAQRLPCIALIRCEIIFLSVITLTVRRKWTRCALMFGRQKIPAFYFQKWFDSSLKNERWYYLFTFMSF